MRLAIPPLFILLTCTGPATLVVLNLEPGGSFDLTYALDTGQNATTTLDLSGTIEAEIGLVAGTPVDFRFTGGRMLLSDEDMTVRNVAGGDVEILTRDVVGVFKSNSQAGGLTDRDRLINEGHSLVYQEGTITTRYVLDVRFVGRVVVGEDVRDLSSDPDASALVGTTTISATLLEEAPLLSHHRIDLRHTRDETRTQPVSAEITDLTGANHLLIREAGSFTASGEILACSEAFVTWASTTRGLVPASIETIDPSTGQPLAVLYAMNAPPGPWSPPVTFDPATSRVELTLPDAGLKSAIRCEYSSTLGAASWSPPTSAEFPNGMLPVTTSGSITLPIPPGSSGFVRLVAVPQLQQTPGSP